MIGTIVYAIALAAVLLYALQSGVAAIFGKSAHLIHLVLGKNTTAHYVWHILVGLAALVVLFAHVPLVGQPRVYVVDGFAPSCKDAEGKDCEKGSKGCVCKGCEKKDGSGNTVECKYPEDKDVEECKPCAEQFIGSNSVDVQQSAQEEQAPHGVEPAPASFEGAPLSALG